MQLPKIFSQLSILYIFKVQTYKVTTFSKWSQSISLTLTIFLIWNLAPSGLENDFHVGAFMYILTFAKLSPSRSTTKVRLS